MLVPQKKIAPESSDRGLIVYYFFFLGATFFLAGFLAMVVFSSHFFSFSLAIFFRSAKVLTLAFALSGMFFGVSAFHSLNVFSLILPSLTIAPNLRRCASDLNGMIPPIL